MTPGQDSSIPWHTAMHAAGSVQGMWPHHLDLWLDRWTRTQHLVMVGALDAMQPGRAAPLDTPPSGKR